MGKVLVAYATKTGCTQGVAEKIGETLAEMGAEVEVHAANKAPKAGEYDAVIVGSGVRAGNWHGPAKKYIRKNADALKERPMALFVSCLTMVAEPEKVDEVRAYTDKLLEETGVEPTDYGFFGGWFIPEKFSPVGRSILQKFGAEEGDFRDWDNIEAWAREAGGKLGIS